MKPTTPSSCLGNDLELVHQWRRMGQRTDWGPATYISSISAQTGRTVVGPLTAWVVGDGPDEVEHVAGIDADGHLLVFWSSTSDAAWNVVDATNEAGPRITGELTSWISQDGPFTVEHVAARAENGDLHVFWWSPRTGHWQAVNATAEAGLEVAGALTSWVTTGDETVEHVAAVGPNAELLVFSWSSRTGRWQVVDASAEASARVVGPLTSWSTGDGAATVEHVAGPDSSGDLRVFWRSSHSGRWQAVNATAEAGTKVTGAVASWITHDGPFTVEHIAASGIDGHLRVFWWSPRHGRWQAIDASREAAMPPAIVAAPGGLAVSDAGQTVEAVTTRSEDLGLPYFWWTPALHWQALDFARILESVECRADPVAWLVPGSQHPERIAFKGHDDSLYSLRISGRERRMTDALREPAFSLVRRRHVRRKVLTILWDPHKPGVSRPSRSVVEDVVHGAIGSVRHYFLENSSGLFTIENAGVVGWFDADHPPSAYWPPDGSPGRDSGAEAIRKAAAEIDLAAFDLDGDGNLTSEELGILFILPGTASGGGLVRVVGEDFTTRETAQGITVDGVKVTWIAEVSIGAPPIPGIVAHELSHLLLGHGDMYFNFFQPAAAGAYSLMDQHAFAPHMDPFAKLKLGWLRPRLVFGSGRHRLPDVESTGTALVLADPSRGVQEYFIIENRFRGESFDRMLPDQGLAIWHIMEDPATFNAALPPPNVTPEQWSTVGGWSRKGIRMIRPIPSPPFDDTTALWDGSDPATGYDLLSEDPNPLHATLRWGDGTPSGFSLLEIPPAGREVVVRVEVRRIVTFSTKDRTGGLASLCNPAEAWKSASVEEVVDDIRAGRRIYYAEANGVRARIHVVEGRKRAYLRTDADQIEENNLGELPSC